MMDSDRRDNSEALNGDTVQERRLTTSAICVLILSVFVCAFAIAGFVVPIDVGYTVGPPDKVLEWSRSSVCSFPLAESFDNTCHDAGKCSTSDFTDATKTCWVSVNSMKFNGTIAKYGDAEVDVGEDKKNIIQYYQTANKVQSWFDTWHSAGVVWLISLVAGTLVAMGVILFGYGSDVELKNLRMGVVASFVVTLVLTVCLAHAKDFDTHILALVLGIVLILYCILNKVYTSRYLETSSIAKKANDIVFAHTLGMYVLFSGILHQAYLADKLDASPGKTMYGLEAFTMIATGALVVISCYFYIDLVKAVMRQDPNMGPKKTGFRDTTVGLQPTQLHERASMLKNSLNLDC